MKIFLMGLAVMTSLNLLAGQYVSTAQDYRRVVRQSAERVAGPDTIIVSKSATKALVTIYPLNQGRVQSSIKNNDTIKEEASKMIDADINGQSNDAVIHFKNNNDRYIGSVAVLSMSKNRWVKPDYHTAMQLVSMMR